MKSLSNKPSGCSRLIIPVTALGILSSLLMPEVRDEISELLFPTTPQYEHPSSMEVTVDTNGKVNGVLLSGEVAYKYYQFVQEQLDQSAPGLIEKLKKAGTVWNTETEVEKMHQDVSDILISNPTIKDYIERGFIKTGAYLQRMENGDESIIIILRVPFQEKEPIKVEIPLKKPGLFI